MTSPSEQYEAAQSRALNVFANAYNFLVADLTCDLDDAWYNYRVAVGIIDRPEPERTPDDQGQRDGNASTCAGGERDPVRADHGPDTREAGSREAQGSVQGAAD